MWRDGCWQCLSGFLALGIFLCPTEPCHAFPTRSAWSYTLSRDGFNLLFGAPFEGQSPRRFSSLRTHLPGRKQTVAFREQRANWSEVVGWSIAESDGIWWLLNKEGRVLLSFEWLYLPDEEVPAAKAFIVEHLCCLSLSPSSVAQPFLSRFQNFRRLLLGVRFSSYASVLGYWLARWLGEDLIAIILALVALMLAIATLVGILLSGGSILLFGRAKFLVCGDQLIEADSGVTIHLPSVRRLKRTSNGITLVGADGQTIFIPSHLTALWDYLRTCLPSVGDLEERTSSEHK